MTRFEEGKKMLAQTDGTAAERVLESLSTIAPDVGKFIIEFGFGEIYTREGLSLQEREMITLASLLTQGDTADQLRVHLHAALNVGLSQEKIIEIFIQCIPYVGFPRVLNAIYTAKEVFEKAE